MRVPALLEFRKNPIKASSFIPDHFPLSPLPSDDNKSLPQVDTTALSGDQIELSRVLQSHWSRSGSGFALIGWILILLLLRQLSYAIKTQLKEPKTATRD